MHGRQQAEYKALQRDPKVSASLAKKANQWFTLTAQITPDNALALTEKLLTVNPDPLYLWNQRRLVHTTNSSDDNTHDDNDDNTASSGLEWETESHLTALALQNNPKAYGAWFHRKWCLVHLLLPLLHNKANNKVSVTLSLRQELGLTVQFLERDERNFHCWNYRRFVISLLLLQRQQRQQPSPSSDAAAANAPGAWTVLMDEGSAKEESVLLMGAQMAAAASAAVSKKEQADDEQQDDDTATTTDWIAHEWDFTETKIQQNFSNFSAFHYRSKLYGLKRPALSQELELLENAIFTEPDDQTAWWYQSFLLRQSHKKTKKSKDDDNNAAWQAHVANIKELRQEVPKSKWVLLGLLNCQMHLVASIDGTADGGTKKKEVLQYCQELLELDPDRTGRYNSLRRQIENNKFV